MSRNDDWYLRDWLRHFEKIQSSLVNELGWDKARANFVWHSKQGYRRELVNEVADWLGIEPYELLMKPDDAMALRQLRQSARKIVEAESEASEEPRSGARKAG